MDDVANLLAAVDSAFAATARGLETWPDPHPDRVPLDGEYSRVTDPSRYRLIGARADAWVAALIDRQLATTSNSVDWIDPPPTALCRAVLVLPFTPGALPLVVARHRLADCSDAGVTLGAGHPSRYISFFPDCGCDACDSGSQNELDVVDRQLQAIVTGRYWRISRGDRQITVVDEGLSTSNVAGRDVEAVLRDHTGWVEITGAPWVQQ